MLVHIVFRLDGRALAETKASAVPGPGDRVALELFPSGRRTYRVADTTHQYTDSGTRQVATVRPGPILVDLEEIPDDGAHPRR